MHVLPSLRSGGTENRVLRLVRALDPAAFRASLLILTDTGELRPSLDGWDIPVVAVARPRVPRWLPRRLGLALYLVRFVRALRSLEPDIVHAHLAAPNIYSAVARATFCRQAPLVVSKASLGTYKKGRPVLRAAERWANGVADRIAVNSTAVAEAVARCERAPRDKMEVLYNGVDLELFSAASPPSAERSASPRIGVIANLRPRKGHTTLLDAMSLVVESHPTARLICIGRDDGELAGLQARAASLGVEESVEFLGHRSDIPCLLRSLDVVVHPSEEEGFSNAILEAMAAGRAVVATAVGGTPEAVLDGVTGFLVPPGDPVRLADRIAAVLSSPDLARRMGIAGRRRVEECFSLPAAVTRHEQLYTALHREACSGRRARGAA